jgi:hypothetical protein
MFNRASDILINIKIILIGAEKTREQLQVSGHTAWKENVTYRIITTINRVIRFKL